MSEPVNLVNGIANGIVELFSNKNSKSNKIKTGLSLIAILFIVIPIIFHFLALQEQQLYVSIISEVSSIETENLNEETMKKYEELVSSVDDNQLFINKINKTVTNFISILTKNASSIYEKEITGWFSYVGFDYKPDIFFPVFYWNLIPLILLAIIVLISVIPEMDYYTGLSKILHAMLLGLGFGCVVTLYSAFIAYILSILAFYIIHSVIVTIICMVIISLVVTAFLLWLLLEVF